MQIAAICQLFPLFETAESETLEGLSAIATEHEYPAERAVVIEDAWGNAIYFVISGWVKVRLLTGETEKTLAILGRGDFFGEMAILDESPRSTDVVSLSPVHLFSISAQRFTQMLFKDGKFQHRLLQLMVKRLRQSNLRLQLRGQPSAVKLANTLVSLAESYGQPLESGINIYNLPHQDLADVSDIGLEDTHKIMEKLDSKGWVKANPGDQTLQLLNLKQLMHLAGRV
ncbi:transcriptional regulator [Neosynechococcus sphagnicola sy1]|uniref:Transcriptional regulator n=1 Tax=Neosynechococcus sphagnicola sy1 TaxID=1497020 RepID=A0A098TJP2_9CYAN|nr:Crp/Fnr family transcriptional regulator [Neosynechococcus sphagnicola]KGF72539.1 transcriptional regulator [Neosynechococcus sphagnicola sy1]